MIKIPEKQASRAVAAATMICPVCGAALREAGVLCRYCGFDPMPLGGPLPSVEDMAADIMRLLRDLGALRGELKILVLIADDDLRDGVAAFRIDDRITFIGEEGLCAGARADLLLVGDALARAADVNSLMTGIGATLSPRGRMVAAGPGGRFGGNSLQILLERHGFRLASRPLKWRLLDRTRRRIVARKL